MCFCLPWTLTFRTYGHVIEHPFNPECWYISQFCFLSLVLGWHFETITSMTLDCHRLCFNPTLSNFIQFYITPWSIVHPGSHWCLLEFMPPFKVKFISGGRQGLWRWGRRWSPNKSRVCRLQEVVGWGNPLFWSIFITASSNNMCQMWLREVWMNLDKIYVSKDLPTKCVWTFQLSTLKP